MFASRHIRPLTVYGLALARERRNYRGDDRYVPSLASECFIDRSGPVIKRPTISAQVFEAGRG